MVLDIKMQGYRAAPSSVTKPWLSADAGSLWHIPRSGESLSHTPPALQEMSAPLGSPAVGGRSSSTWEKLLSEFSRYFLNYLEYQGWPNISVKRQPEKNVSTSWWLCCKGGWACTNHIGRIPPLTFTLTSSSASVLSRLDNCVGILYFSTLQATLSKWFRRHMTD